MLRVALFIAAAVLPAAAQLRDVLKSSDLDAMLGQLKQERLLLKEADYEIWLGAQDGGSSTAGRPGADQIIHLRKGSARVFLADTARQAGPGDLLHVPRGARFRMEPVTDRVEYVAVRILASGKGIAPRAGFLAPRRMPDILRKAEIDRTIDTNDRNQPLHSSNAYTVNYVIYAGRPGPWEAHRGCVDVYFLQRGTAKAQLGGEIVNPHEESPGEIRGDGVAGARQYAIGPGDMVHIPRNGAHHMAPDGNKLAYLLLKIWSE
jgi:mannose-6-phosphate isomerase-like protein (cupin superfamily)